MTAGYKEIPNDMGNETFPLRIKLKPVKIFDKPVKFKPLIPNLNSSQTGRSGVGI